VCLRKGEFGKPAAFSRRTISCLLPPAFFFLNAVIIKHPSRPYWRDQREATTQLAVYEREVVTQPTEFSRIFEAHHSMVFRTAYRITGNAADAEDVLQTIFLRILRQPSGVALNQEESYLRRAAVNASLDVIRQRQTNRTVPLDEASTRSQPSADADIKDCLRRALQTLTSRSAEIFALRYFEDFTNPQIAAALSISQVVVAVSLHRTRRQLQKQITACMGVQK
jgi:RNA polymerase sigma-70 factor (ECF subfamily)